jgi:hypothetical protein
MRRGPGLFITNVLAFLLQAAISLDLMLQWTYHAEP